MRFPFTVYDAVTGEVHFSGDTHSEAAAIAQATDAGQAVLLGIQVDPSDGYVHNGEILPFPPKPDDTIPWVWSYAEAQWTSPFATDQDRTDHLRAQQALLVNAERARRLAAPMPFGSTTFDMDPTSKQRITGAGALAGFALGAGALPGDLFWHGGDTPFAWIDAENARVPMDALACFGLAQAAARRESVLIGCADVLKRMPSLPDDWRDDTWWSEPAGAAPDPDTTPSDGGPT